MSREVTCINKREHANPHERITHIGGSWGKIGENEAITEIERDSKAYHVKQVWVVVATKNGRKYLKTQSDGETPNNLLSLPECR